MLEILLVSLLLGAKHVSYYSCIVSYMPSRFRYPHEAANRMTCTTLQLVLINMSIFNLIDTYRNNTQELLSPNTITVQTNLAAMFIYDTAFLLYTPRGRQQYMMFAHHVLAIILIYLACIPGIGNDQMNNYVFLVLETASPLINMMKICEEMVPGAHITHHMHLWTTVMYFLTRMVLLPLWMVDFLLTHTYSNSFSISQMASFVCTGCIWIASVQWFARLLKPRLKV